MATSRAASKPLSSSVNVAAATAAEIASVATAVGRSVGFVVERALAAAGKLPSDAVESGDVVLQLTLDEDDPADLHARMTKRAGGLPLDVAVTLAWRATRTRFSAWVERERQARTAEVADDLDAALAAAREKTTTADALIALGTSVYPRVRALVAAHPATPAATLALLARDREPYVRDAVANR